jgi:hypothetical protein
VDNSSYWYGADAHDRYGVDVMTGGPSDDALTQQVRELLVKVLREADFPGTDELLRQASDVRVAGGPVTMLELQSSHAAASVCADGPVPLSMLVADGGGDSVGELLIWVTRGHLSGLEFAWWTDDAPDELPTADRVKVDRK